MADDNDKKLQASEEIAAVSSDGKVGAVRASVSGQMTPPGSIPLDQLMTQADVPMPLSVESEEGIVTLTPSPRPDATNKNYQSRVVWVAVYSDGDQIAEYDEEGNQVSSENIDHERLREFKLVDRKGRTVISQEIIPGQCFFYRRRTALQTGRDVVEVMHMFGWRAPHSTTVKEDGEVEKLWVEHLCVLFESDMHVEMGCFDSKPVDPSANLSGRKAWKYPPNWRDIDEVPAV